MCVHRRRRVIQRASGIKERLESTEADLLALAESARATLARVSSVAGLSNTRGGDGDDAAAFAAEQDAMDAMNAARARVRAAEDEVLCHVCACACAVQAMSHLFHRAALAASRSSECWSL